MFDKNFLLLGYLLFCAGTLLGIPHGLSKRRGDLKNTELWRVAHLSTCVGGVSLIAMTMALGILLEDRAIYTLVPFTAAAYCFFVACTLSGSFNLSWDGNRNLPMVRLIYALQILASALSVIAIIASVVALLLRYM
jgi:hypothetical protein